VKITPPQRNPIAVIIFAIRRDESDPGKQFADMIVSKQTPVIRLDVVPTPIGLPFLELLSSPTKNPIKDARTNFSKCSSNNTIKLPSFLF
jgi:hypothetical protein